MARILSLMFHRIHDPFKKDRVIQFEQFLKQCKSDYPIVLPNEIISSLVLSNKIISSNSIPNARHSLSAHSIFTNRNPYSGICLTFDDAYFDFYYYVFPILKKLNLKAILAVPVNAISEDTRAKPIDRLSNKYIHHTALKPCYKTTPLCTWKELQIMADSGHVIMASHGFQHADLTLKSTNIQEEVVYSKKILSERLNIPVDYFVYPFGRTNARIHPYVLKYYTCALRIGSAYNFPWNIKKGLIYRMNADPFWKHNRNLSRVTTQWKLILKNGCNRLRRK